MLSHVYKYVIIEDYQFHVGYYQLVEVLVDLSGYSVA